MKIHEFERWYGRYYCTKCGNYIEGENKLYFIGNNKTYCHKCFPKMERKIKLKNIERLK